MAVRAFGAPDNLGLYEVGLLFDYSRLGGLKNSF